MLVVTIVKPCSLSGLAKERFISHCIKSEVGVLIGVRTCVGEEERSTAPALCSYSGTQTDDASAIFNLGFPGLP